MVKLKKIKVYFYSDWFIITIATFVTLSWYFKIDIIGYIVMFSLVAFLLFVTEEITPLLVLFVLGPLILQPINPHIEASKIVQYYSLTFIGIIPAALAIIFHFIYYKRKLVFGKYFLPMVAVAIAAALGGLFFYDIVRTQNVVWGLIFGVPYLLLYFLFSNYLDDNDKTDIIIFFAKIIMWAGIVIMIQMTLFLVGKEDIMKEILSKNIKLGWGVTNMIANMFLFIIPFTLFLSTKLKRGYIYIVITAFMYLYSIITLSRGGLAVLALMLPFYLYFTYKKSEDNNKKNLLIIFGIISIIVISIFIVFHNNIILIAQVMFQKGLSTSGRADLFSIGINSFLKNPLFGSGFAYLGPFDGKSFQWYHSTFFQIVASTGIIGIIAYGYQYFIKYKLILQNRSKFNLFVLLAFIGAEIYALMETATFMPSPFMIYFTLIIVIIEINNKRHEAT